MSIKYDNMSNDRAKNDLLILTDAQDNEVGTCTKERAHRLGLLHRAFSVVLYRSCDGTREYLISKRAECKYHSAGLWANSCCSHPRAGETAVEAAKKRVSEELGCGCRDLIEIGSFVYRAEFENGLCEYEFDHVLIGSFDGTLHPDPSEVGKTLWVNSEELNSMLVNEPASFAPWAFTVLSMALAYEQRADAKAESSMNAQNR